MRARQTRCTIRQLTRITMLVALLAAGADPLMGQGGRQGAPGGAPGGPGGQGGQGARGQGGGRGQAPQANLPTAPTAVALPTLSAEVTGPGPMFDSSPSLPPGKGPATYGYEVKEYFVSGTANGQPYTTRMVVRKPAKSSAFTGLVLAESMHGSGAAHMFEFTSIYTMSSGHAAVEILTTSPQQFVQLNEARYKDLRVAGGQANEIIAQVGALVRTGKPLGGAVRKMVLSGTSMSAGTLLNYIPAHLVYRTPEMQRIYDGFMPTSNGASVPDVDVPVIHLPTMHEVANPTITNKQDSDEAGKQYRLYEFSGIAHIDTRDSFRMKPNPCAIPLSEFPHQAYMSVGLHHLFQWVDRGVAPPRGERMWTDRNDYNDGSPMVLDVHGNPRGGIRNTYVDIPTAKYTIRPPAITPVIPNGSAYIKAGGQQAANQMCGLSGAQVAFSQAKLKELYGTKKHYTELVERRLTELERQGWSLPVYRELILSDAAKINF
jgi:Alpha/beta hydrolase domain